MIARFGRLLMTGALAALVIGGCKQGVGEVCQVDDDCETRVCNPQTKLCQDTAAPAQDSGTPDAPAIDAPPVDAPPDAPPDGPPVDAS